MSAWPPHRRGDVADEPDVNPASGFGVNAPDGWARPHTETEHRYVYGAVPSHDWDSRLPAGSEPRVRSTGLRTMAPVSTSAGAGSDKTVSTRMPSEPAYTDAGLAEVLEGDTRTAEELLSAVALGDERAFERLYDRLAAPVTGMVRAVVRNQAQSEEVVQEVFVQLWQTAPKYRQDRGGVHAWAMTVAHHRAVDRVRAAQAHANRERAAFVRSYSGSPYDGVVEQVLDNCERKRVRECLRALTDLERESIVLAYYQALTYRQVAEVLGVATGTVKGRMRAGLRRLHHCLTHDSFVAPADNGSAAAQP